MITRDKHFELLPEMDAPEGAAFGIGLPVGLDNGGFVPGSTDWAIQDSENSQNGSTAFGRDRLLGPVWSWQLHIDTQSEAEALAALRPFAKAWKWMHGRNVPGKVTALRFQLEGEQRRIYGRPRRFEAPPDNKILSGYVPVSVDFKCVDGFVYDDVMTEVVLLLGRETDGSSEDTGGGFVFPVTFPTDTLPPTRQQSQILIGGDEPAYPIVRFTGPVTNPVLSTSDFTLELRYDIPDGQYVEIDTRPWRNTVLLNGNAGLGGKLAPRTRLSKIVLNPGRFQAKYSGFSTGQSTCSVRWANTYDSY